ncbi:VOC family protein [Halostagnicola kamekurae]|uniref:Glyoxalase superfamily enzyme, possibly 3-demethylubiquinone-9 3-methyltransferase n=1 Tax=Halostagnicola kamekurae TaxID=619731 RepID=A0A1I6U8A0_9EURY|nr:VOC family protein [Halostagnicola kamekurae]SFS97644.1 Glyoxalase superfamily enzyme, possibly 3-demethylubiquinone-9 3-methyltransferase [Halostagnicola kamekurae]
MQKITPTLWFDDDAADAVDRYTTIFEDASTGSVGRYDEASAAASGRPEGSVMTIEFELEGRSFVALNGGPEFEFNPSISFIVNCPTAEAVDELWTELAADGETLMSLGSYPFSDRYGWVTDEFGVSWQLIHAPDVPERKLVPSLLFAGERCGQAEAAMAFYTSAFDDAEINEIARYGADQEPDEEGTVTFAEFTLAGQRFAAMDSTRAHDSAFNEAISFAVDCTDQEEVDYYWDALTADGGAEGQCGWLTDKYGVSWQVVPAGLTELLRDEDTARATRVTEAMLRMRKLDLEELRNVHAGTTGEEADV